VDEKYLRAEELKYLKGDSTKLRETLGWKPEYTFESMMHEMIEYELASEYGTSLDMIV